MQSHNRVARTKRPPTEQSSAPASSPPAQTDVIQVPAMREITADIEQATEGFPWFQEENRRQAQTYLSGLAVAREHALGQQVELYMEELQRIVTTDVKERVTVWAEAELGFSPFAYYHPSDQRLPTREFKGPLVEQQFATYQWVYYPMEAFSRLIPPHALQALSLLEAQGLTPQAYWVADLQDAWPVLTVSHSRTLDPVLCAQFHRWFVGIAAWV